MSKKSTFTTITPLSTGITREVVIEFLHNHQEMIDLNPLVIERHPIKPPPQSNPEEYHCIWWSMTDKISYLPGGFATGDITYTCAFHDLHNGLQTHCYAPMGTDIRSRWTLGGNLPGEPIEPMELGIGAPLTGLYIREDVELRCSFVMTSFVKKTLKKAHSTLVDRMAVKAQIATAADLNHSMSVHRAAAQQFGDASSHSGGERSSFVPRSRSNQYSTSGTISGIPMPGTQNSAQSSNGRHVGLPGTTRAAITDALGPGQESVSYGSVQYDNSATSAGRDASGRVSWSALCQQSWSGPKPYERNSRLTTPANQNQRQSDDSGYGTIHYGLGGFDGPSSITSLQPKEQPGFNAYNPRVGAPKTKGGFVAELE